MGHAGITLDRVGPEQEDLATIEAWRNRPIEGEHPYVHLDGIVLERSWACEVRNVSLLGPSTSTRPFNPVKSGITWRLGRLGSVSGNALAGPAMRFRRRKAVR